MQQSSVSVELPQFTSLSTLALRLVQAYTSWHDPETGADVFTYFARPRSNDELGLRASLIRELVLPVFHYTSDQIEFESQKRCDLILWKPSLQKMDQQETGQKGRRKI